MAENPLKTPILNPAITFFPQRGQRGAIDMFVSRVYQCIYEKIALGIIYSRSIRNSTGLIL